MLNKTIKLLLEAQVGAGKMEVLSAEIQDKAVERLLLRSLSGGHEVDAQGLVLCGKVVVGQDVGDGGEKVLELHGGERVKVATATVSVDGVHVAHTRQDTTVAVGVVSLCKEAV